MSLGMIVTRFAWIAHKLVSSKRPTRYASDASWRAPMAALWKRRSVLKSCAISRTSRWNGSFLISSSVDFWYLRISRRATVPGLSWKLQKCYYIVMTNPSLNHRDPSVISTFWDASFIILLLLFIYLFFHTCNDVASLHHRWMEHSS